MGSPPDRRNSAQQGAMSVVSTLVVLVSLLVLAGVAALYLGLFPVAATTPHWSVTEWALATGMESGVERRAAGVVVPADLDDPARIRSGAAMYDAMCVPCHAAPGVEAGEIAEGLLPAPPELAHEAEEWSAGELFWITRHGIRMTGMAAFGPTHSDQELWDVVALLRRLPEMSPSEYAALTAGEDAAAGHRHDGGHGDHPH